MGLQLKLKMTVFFQTEAEVEGDNVLVLHGVVDVVAPTNIIDIFTV